MKDLKYELSRLPDLPGVYLMKDENDEIIYVGKAKNLKNRVRSYFNSDSGKSMKVIKMVEKIDHFEYIIVENEVEALVLESNFIKEHRPHYNILLRDDKQYPYIMLTNEDFPRIEKVRQVKNDGNEYFGPYPNAYAVNDVIRLLQNTFRLRLNKGIQSYNSRKRPPLKDFLYKYNDPTHDYNDRERYLENVEKVRSFLRGNTKELTDKLESKMLEYSKNLEFERASEYRDHINSINQLMERQKVTTVGLDNRDIVSMVKARNYVTIQVFFMRNGKIIDREHFIIKNEFNDSDADILSSFMKQFYIDMTYIPREILIVENPAEQEIIEKILSEKKGKKVSIKVPKRGEKVGYIEMATKNAQKMMYEYLKKIDDRERSKNLGLKKLEDLLDIHPLDRIEIYDISNISGVDSVGSMVVYEQGRKAKKDYRKFKIKTVEGPDDYASMREVLTRRFTRLMDAENSNNSFSKRPDLVIMDGGKGQVNAAISVLNSFNLKIPVIGLVKDDKHKTRGIILDNNELNIDKDSAIYRFLYDMQEEVHRFAINYHNTVRKKKLFESELKKIDGLGEKRIIALLKHFGSINKIKEASKEQLKEVDLINENIADNIIKYFGEKNG
ncbi:excinuclease ABC subunit UvrC [Helcococcus kunzii]|uniref:excinuclease ABC subunit UvrC n=1 Tax=Helcococcus kunzii TaxID=40091 RepID=UPI001C9432BD|nr:excinuclease ABC subunit UvrC [Helcococcus kunzii]MCT1795819.1 excinuclease ABC subunit UvrC [Helcococcus kunzii]MCT1989398.1 excinuclease ABC subunit UvrC [Helcococcus kunzii]QZO75768.1 excinuclease ABC subunit UvrC [Helcococcus kunzii]